jgi:hypothetical protein
MTTARRLLALGLVVGCVALFAARARAQLFLGWADEFTSGHVTCSIPSAQSNKCLIHHFWLTNPAQDQYPVSWDFVGGQGSDLQGRRNAREKIMFNFRDASSSHAITATVDLFRWRVTNPPSPGSDCLDGGFGTFLGGSSYTTTSNQFPLEAHYHNHRLRPIFDFESEGGFGGQTVGYRSLLRLSGQIHPSGSPQVIDQNGCFKIHWFP